MLSRRSDYNQGTHDNENIIVLPDNVFVCTVTITSNEEEQDEEILRPWVDPHKLKKVDTVWYKEGRCMVMGSLTDKHTIIKSHHNPPVYGHPGISKTM